MPEDVQFGVVPATFSISTGKVNHVNDCIIIWGRGEVGEEEEEEKGKERIQRRRE